MHTNGKIGSTQKKFPTATLLCEDIVFPSFSLLLLLRPPIFVDELCRKNSGLM